MSTQGRFGRYDNDFQGASNCQGILDAYLKVLPVAPQSSEPYPILFAQSNCEQAKTGRYPSTEEDLAKAYRGFQTLPFALESLYVPFNQFIELRSSDGRQTARFLGPSIEFTAAGADLSLYSQVQFFAQKPWNDFLADFCFGVDYSIGNQDLQTIRGPDGNLAWPYLPPSVSSSTECNTFMADTYCLAGGPESESTRCGCFRDQEMLKAQYPTLELPVICFGQRCEHGGFKTSTMLEDQCSPAVCGQIIQESAGTIIDTGTVTIYCNSNFYLVPTVSPVPQPTTNPEDSSGGGLSTTAGVIIGVALLILGGLIAGLVVSLRKKKPGQT